MFVVDCLHCLLLAAAAVILGFSFVCGIVDYVVFVV